jgi:hypothetical protein
VAPFSERPGDRRGFNKLDKDFATTESQAKKSRDDRSDSIPEADLKNHRKENSQI